jgi:putative ABC transport system permease protein
LGIARLKPGVTLEQAKSSMDVVAAQLAQAYPDSNKGLGMKIWSLQ